MSSDGSSRRPQSGPSGVWGARPARQELAESTAVGEIYLRRLVRAQLALSLLGLLSFGGVLVALPIAVYLLDGVRVLGLPLGVLLLAVPLFPLLVAIGHLYARRANALDDAFRDLVGGGE